MFTPHGIIELTPTSKLLVLNGLDLEWVDAKDLKIQDKVAIANALPEIKEIVPNILDFVGETTRFVKNSFKLIRKGKIPEKITNDLLYLLGLLAGDGHLRYNYKDQGVSTISLTNADENIIKEYKRIVKELFDLEDMKYDGKYGYYFNSRPIGNLIKNFGIPVKSKSKTLFVPKYMISLPKEFIASYLKGLFDTDGHVHLVPSGMQISYYTVSKKMLIGVKYLLLRLGIQATFRHKKDGTYELTISDKNALEIFKKVVGLNHNTRKENLETQIITKYTKPIYNRIP